MKKREYMLIYSHLGKSMIKRLGFTTLQMATNEAIATSKLQTCLSNVIVYEDVLEQTKYLTAVVSIIKQ